MNILAVDTAGKTAGKGNQRPGSQHSGHPLAQRHRLGAGMGDIF